MGTEHIGKLMGQYAVPCIISLLVGALYNIVDQIFIANANYLGSYGNAANTVVFPLTVVALAIAVMVGDGETDVELSLRGGLTPVSATWGFRSREALEAIFCYIEESTDDGPFDTTEHVLLAEAEKDARGGKQSDGEHEALAEPLKQRESGNAQS